MISTPSTQNIEVRWWEIHLDGLDKYCWKYLRNTAMNANSLWRDNFNREYGTCVQRSSAMQPKVELVLLNKQNLCLSFPQGRRFWQKLTRESKWAVIVFVDWLPTVFKQFSFQSSTSSCIGWESDWPSAPFVCCNESFSRTVLVGIQKNKNRCNFFFRCPRIEN